MAGNAGWEEENYGNEGDGDSSDQEEDYDPSDLDHIRKLEMRSSNKGNGTDDGEPPSKKARMNERPLAKPLRDRSNIVEALAQRNLPPAAPSGDGDYPCTREMKLLKEDVVKSCGDGVYPADRHLVYRKVDKLSQLNGGHKGPNSNSESRKMSYGSLKVIKSLQYDPSKSSPFDTLSDEIVVKIMEFLPRSSLVNLARTAKRMRSISYDEALWKRVDFGGKTLCPGIVGLVVSRGTRVLRMAKSHVSAPLFGALPDRPGELSPLSFPRLQYLDLSMAIIEEKCLATLIGSCRNLLKLGLEHCALTDRCCEAIGRNEKLGTLHLGMTTGLSITGIENLSNLKNLVELNLAWVGMTDLMLSTVLSRLIAANSKTLEQLNIAGCKDVLQDDSVTYIVKNCDKLKELDISDARKLTAGTIDSCVRYGLNLETLSVSRCYMIPPRKFLDVVDLPLLSHFNAYGMMKEEGVRELKGRLEPTKVNATYFSQVARPTVGVKRTSIWNMRTRESNCK